MEYNITETIVTRCIIIIIIIIIMFNHQKGDSYRNRSIIETIENDAFT